MQVPPSSFLVQALSGLASYAQTIRINPTVATQAETRQSVQGKQDFARFTGMLVDILV